jgi:hypothetical protein
MWEVSHLKYSLRAALFMSSVLFLTAGMASADSLITYQFTGGGITASFELPVNPTVLEFTPGTNFQVMPIDLLINGAPSSDKLSFFSAGKEGGGFEAICGLTCSDINLAGPQLYSGPEGSPTMLGVVAGGVALTDFMTGAPAGSLTTPGTPGSVSTPEPSATVLLGIGLLAVGLAVLGFKPRFAISAN